ncbi:MAG TPA: glycosyltransferase family 39 protein [Candidatus Dormibacteraeota bacterium]
MVTLLGLLLRLTDYPLAPALMDNSDEVQFAWAGLNLIEHGDAYTWSYFPVYPHVGVVTAFGTSFPMVHHWLDHPPGFALLLGGFLWLTGERGMFAIDAAHIRVLPVLFSALTVPLIYLLLRRAAGAWPALVATALLATAPAAILFGREAEPESVMTPLLLVALLLADRLAAGSDSRWRVVALFAICLVEPFFKVTGIAVAAIVGVNLLGAGRWRVAAVCLGAGVAGVAAYALYGWLVDWQLFLRVIAEQAANRKGILSGFEFITAPAGINRPLHDGWWALGWVGIGLLLFLGRRSRLPQLVAWPATAYALLVMVFAGQELTSHYGWYRIMALPLVYAAAGLLAWRAIESPAPARLAALLVLGGAAATNWWLAPPGGMWVANPVFLVVVLALLIVPSALLALPRFARYAGWARAGYALFFGVLLLGNISTSLRLAELYNNF